MKHPRPTLLSTAIAAVMGLGLTVSAVEAQAKSMTMVRCGGIAASPQGGQNFVYVPKGMCSAIVGGTVLKGKTMKVTIKGKPIKCAGIAKAGQNGCGTIKHACAGQSKVSGDPQEWVFLPKGTCMEIKGGKVLAVTSHGVQLAAGVGNVPGNVEDSKPMMKDKDITIGGDAKDKGKNKDELVIQPKGPGGASTPPVPPLEKTIMQPPRPPVR